MLTSLQDLKYFWDQMLLDINNSSPDVIHRKDRGELKSVAGTVQFGGVVVCGMCYSCRGYRVRMYTCCKEYCSH